MSAVDSSYLRVRDDNDNHRRSLSGLTLDAVLSEKHHPPPPVTRTLLDIIRDEEPRRGSYKGLIGHKDKKSWKSFMDGIRLKRAGEAWTTSFPVPASDIPIQSISRPITVSRRSPVRYETISSSSNESTHPNEPSPENTAAAAPAPGFTRPQFSRQGSSRIGLSVPTQVETTQLENSSEISPRSEAFARPSQPQFSCHNSTRAGPTSSDPIILESSVAEDDTEQPRRPTRLLSAALAEERALSAREVVADQEAEEAESAAAASAAAAEAAAAAAEEDEEEEAGAAEAGDEAEPVRMSLMDLLEETDRQMGLVGSRYTVGDEEYDEEEDEGDEEEDDEEEGGSVEYNCCVCMVRHKGAAFIPCGHTFCRLCSRELWVQRGNCPLCNGFILEILDIF